MNFFTVTAENENNSKEFKIIKNYINKNTTVALDIGACIGNFTKFLAENCKRVCAFEPSPYNFKRLKRNTEDYGNIFFYNMALGNTNHQTQTLYMCPNDIGMNRLYDSKWCKNGKKVKVIIRKLDSILFALPFKKVDFVKIDVEGYEYFVLMGMRKLLKRDHPILFIEFHPPSIIESGAEPENIWNILIQELGYNYPIIVSHNIRGTPTTIKSFDELFSITNEIPAINLLFTT